MSEIKTQHTPTPWFDWVEYREAHGRSVVAYRDENGAIMSVLECANHAANTAHIVRACNAHDALVAALGMVIYQYDMGYFGHPLAEAVEQARAALKQAKGEA